MNVKARMRKCEACGEYTLKEVCVRCGARTVSPLPPRFSPTEIPKDAEEGEGVACAAGRRGEMAGGKWERGKSVRGKERGCRGG